MFGQAKGLKYIWLVIVIALIALGSLGAWWWLTQNKGLVSYTSPKGEIVKVATPHANQKIISPLIIAGEIKGNWSFEANLPATLTDTNGNIVAKGSATLQGDWMTSNYVPFTGILTFTNPGPITIGYLVIEKDNPSGDTALDDAVKIPVHF